MSLTHSQKKYIKKNLHSSALEDISSKLHIPEQKILQYLKDIWRKDKYDAFIKQIKKTEINNNFIPNDIQLKKFLLSNWFSLLFFAILVFTVYANSLNNAFVSDDIPSILKEPRVGSLSYSLKTNIPVRLLMFFIANKLGGLNPLFYRLINVLFHLGSVFIVFFLFSTFFSVNAAFIGASFFAVHPILIESVTWITGGTYAEYSFFLLLSLLIYIKKSNNNIKKYFFSFIAFCLAVFTSEKAVVFPFIIFVYELSQSSFRKNWKKIIPFFIVVLIYLVFFLGIGAVSQRMTALQTQYYQENTAANPLIQIPIAISSYLQLIIWPSVLTFYHSELVFSNFEFTLRSLLTLVFVLGIFYSFFKNKTLFFWLMFFIISLLPTLTPLGISWVVAERYVYLGTAGIIGVIVYLINRLEQKNNYKTLLLFVCTIAIILLGARTVRRNMDWKNEDTLWLATGKTSPSDPKTHNNLGDYYSRHNDLSRAAEEFKKAIELNPKYADAYHNLANVYQKMNKTEDAVKNYKKAISINPSLWQSYQNLGNIYFNQGKFKLAEESILKAIKISPNNSDLYINILKLKKKKQKRH